MEKKYKFYCDMDGVLVDFIKGYYDLTGKDLTGAFHSGDAFWEPINKAGLDFWVNLDWTPDGKELWKYIEKYKPEILSAPSKNNDSRVGKHQWVKRELPDVHLLLRYRKDKKEFASPNSILIDDLDTNVDSWREAGGIAILHTSTENTIKELKKLNL